MRVAILLAAGRSHRFGRRDKLLEPLAGRPLVLHALDRAARAPAVRLIVVAPRGRRAAVLRRAAPAARIVHPAAGEPLAASLAAAARALRPCEREAFVFLGDMPVVPAGLAGRLVPLRGRGTRPQHRGQPGHPVLLRTAALGGAAGDRGPRIPAGRVAGGPGCVRDIDTRGALRRLRHRLARP